MNSAEALQAYRQQIYEQTGSVSLSGIPLAQASPERPADTRIPFNRLYAKLQAFQHEMPRAGEQHHEDIFYDARTSESSLKEMLSTLAWLGEEHYRRGKIYRNLVRPAPIEPLAAAQTYRRLMILGAPGSGKSTLLQGLAHDLAAQPDAPLPIIVSLAHYAIAKRSDPHLSLREFAFRLAANGDDAIYAALSEHDFLLWLCDDVEALYSFREATINELAQLPGMVALTTRPTGYRIAGLESFAHFELIPMTAQEVDGFIDDCFSALSDVRQTIWDWAEERTEWLKHQFTQKPQLRGQIHNPLFLTYLCALSEAQPLQEIPEERATLYARCLEAALDVGGACADAQSAAWLELPMDARREILQQGLDSLGWHLHANACETSSDAAFLRQTLLNALARDLRNNMPRRDANWLDMAEIALRCWCAAGILQTWMHDGKEYLLFRHAMFREFAAARHIARLFRHNAQLGWTWCSLRLHHYAWQEILILCGHTLDEEHLLTVLRRLVRGVSWFEKLLHRDLLLAVRIFETGLECRHRFARKLIEQIAPLTVPQGKQRQAISRLILIGGGVVIPMALKTIPLFPLWGLALALTFWGALWYAAFREFSSPRFQALFALPERFWPYNPDRQPIIQLLERCQMPEAIPSVVDALKDKQVDVRRAAVETLGAIGSQQVLPHVLEALRDSQSEVRRSAAYALKRLGNVAVLIDALNDKQHDVREAAAEALSLVGDEQAIPELVHGLDDERLDVRKIVIRTLQQIGGEQVIPSLLHTLADSSKEMRLTAVEALGRIGAVDNIYSRLRIVSGLVKILDDEEPLVRWAAAYALGQIGDPEVVPFLAQALRKNRDFVNRAFSDALFRLLPKLSSTQTLKFLNDSDARIRRLTVEYLASATQGEPETLAVVTNALHDEEVCVRREAAEALGRFRRPESVPVLLEALDDEAWEVRWAAVEALGYIGQNDTVLFVAQRLKDSHGYVCRAAIEALGRIGNTAVAEYLIQELKDEKPYIRSAAKHALKQIGDAQIVPFLLQSLKYENDANILKDTENALNQISDSEAAPYFFDALREESARVRQIAVQALGRIGGKEAVAALLNLLHDASLDVRTAVATALGEMADTHASPALLELLRDPNPKLRRIAVKGLGRIGTPDAVPALIEFVQDENIGIRQAAIESLGRIGSPEAVPALMTILQDTSYRERWAAAYALGRIADPHAASVLIESLQNEEDENVRRACAEALGQICDPRSAVTLIHALSDQFWFVRWAAAHALGQIKDQLAVLPLIALFNDSHEKVRWAAVEALGNIGDSRAASSLIQALTDTDWEVCQTAARALTQVCQVETIPALMEAMRQRNEFVRRVAANALRRIEDTRSIPYLIQAIMSDQEFVRTVAAEQIVHLRNVQVIRPLIKLLGDRNREARRYAAEMIGELAHIIDEPKLLKHAAHFLWWRLTDIDEVAKAAFHALKQVANRLSVIKMKR